jgi:hypothetical protein
MRRVYYLSLVMCLTVLAFASIGRAQSSDRRGAGSSLSAGYFIVDSDDNAPAPWRPNFFFMDTNYLPSEWNRVWTGPQQNAPAGQYWFDPTHLNPYQPALMDTLNDCMAGPINMGLSHLWNFYGGSYSNVFFSSNGFIGFMPASYAESGAPPNYCRPNRVNLAKSYSSAPEAIIAGLWTDLDMRHGGPADTSKVYYRTSGTADTFMVNYYMFRLRPSTAVNALPGGFSFSEPGGTTMYCKKFQIILANTDSSIQINYGGFTGGINGFPPLLAYAAFGDNVSIGLANENGSQGTGVIYGPNGGTSQAGSGGWQAINSTCKVCNQAWNQDKQWAIKFKRWIDIVAAVGIKFPTRNYEICLGGSVTPDASFENIDPVNAHTFKCRFTIANAVTGIYVYSRVVSLINVLPGATKDTTFAPYTTNPNVISELGTFNACAIATSYDTNDVNIGDQWPFDDTVCTPVFGVRRTAVPFFDPSDGYSKTSSADIPDQTLWVSDGATVLDGESFTWDPPPPRYPAGEGPDNFVSPVIQFDNDDVNGLPYGGSIRGDTLTSFPINLQGKTTANLTFDFQRAGKFGNGSFFTFPWDAGEMFGPEWTILNVNNGSVLRKGDSLLLEFKSPSQPGCNPAASSWTEIAAIDGGFDFEFKKFFMNLNTGAINLDGIGLSSKSITNYFTADFRFRFRLKSKNDGPSIPPPDDDNDAFFVDNPTVLVPLKPEIEVMWVRVVNPYTKIPASEAISLPVYVKIANLSVNVEIAFPIRVQILDPNGNTVYWQAVVVNSLNEGTDTIIKMPNWNAQDAGAENGGSSVFTVDAWLDQPNFSNPSNITGTYTYFSLNVDEGGSVQEFAYDAGGLDPGLNSGSGWPGLVNITGEGVGFTQVSGSFAMKFAVATQDTFYGVRAYFGSANQAPDYIRVTLLQGEPGSCTPGDTVQQEGVQATVLAQRGPSWDQFNSYYFPKPIVLASNGAEKGVFWAGVSQLGVVNMSLGADLYRGGAIVREWDPFLISPDIQIANNDPYGTQWNRSNNDGDVSCVWAVEATAGSGGWASWAPGQGWWPTMTYAAIPFNEILTWLVPGAGYINGVGAYYSGSYTPSIRAMVSQQGMLPVQLLYLNGEQQNGSALLTWATATETDNSGFTVQRKLANSQDIYENLGFVASKETNSSTETGYGYIDRNVNPGTYDYRLLQTDVNGAQHLSNEVQLTIDPPTGASLSQNYPNPFTPVLGSTEFDYTISVAAPASLVIYNQLGEAVKTLVNGDVGQGSYSVRWDGTDDKGSPVASGSYICKLISGEYSSTIKLTVTK